MENIIEKVDKFIIFFILYTIAFITFFKTLHFTLPFVLAIIFAFLLKRPTKYLVNKFKISPYIASLVMNIIFFTLIISSFLVIITTISSELIQLTRNISTYFASKSQLPSDLIITLQKYYDNLDPSIITSIQKSLSETTAKLANSTIDIGMVTASYLLTILSSIPYIMMVIIFTMITTFLFTKDISVMKTNILTPYLPRKGTKFYLVYSEGKKMLISYFLAYLLILSITSSITFIGFIFLKVKYALVLCVICAVFDVLPILGIANIYFPLAIIYIISKNYYTGIGLLVLYTLVFIVRQIAEPKIMASSLGVHPVAVLIAIFVGLVAGGLGGVVFCMFLIVFYNILRKVKVL